LLVGELAAEVVARARVQVRVQVQVRLWICSNDMCLLTGTIKICVTKNPTVNEEGPTGR
jgi:hypothetical protein